MRFAHVLCSSHLAISDGRYLALAVSPTRSSFTRIRSGEVLHVQSALHGSSVFCTLLHAPARRLLSWLRAACKEEAEDAPHGPRKRTLRRAGSARRRR
ncbi:unnamed protein product, partial [Prorocentrum cordatum]